MGLSLKTLICSYLGVIRQVEYFLFCISWANGKVFGGIHRSYSNLIRTGNVFGFIVIGWRW